MRENYIFLKKKDTQMSWIRFLLSIFIIFPLGCFGPNTSEDKAYDLMIVGRGVVGAASAYHISKLKSKSLKTAIIGPVDTWPKNPEDKLQSSHNDLTRMTKTNDSKLPWSKINRRSLINYRKVEEESGIKFFLENGYLKFLPYEKSIAANNKRYKS